MDAAEIRSRLAGLSPEIPWAHYFDFGAGVVSVSPDDGRYFKKSQDTARIGECMLALCAHHVRGGSAKGKRVLDLACGEGLHSQMFARAGATTLGIDGRALYVDRATFASEAAGLSGAAAFRRGDVRALTPEAYGRFDIVIASGILHHLDQDAFFPFLQGVASLCDDVCFLFTHISTPASIENHGLQGPVTAAGKYEGYLFREHADDASEEQKAQKVRASLDNVRSFWAREEAFAAAVRDAGFSSCCRMVTPTVMQNWDEGAYRPMYVLRTG